jgi:hypothetical protein
MGTYTGRDTSDTIVDVSENGHQAEKIIAQHGSGSMIRASGSLERQYTETESKSVHCIVYDSSL